jgi:glutathione peroxidase
LGAAVKRNGLDTHSLYASSSQDFYILGDLFGIFWLVMKTILKTVCFLATASLLGAQSVYDYSMNTIDGQPESLAAYKGKVLLVVNVASKCGFTPQYAGLQSLYSKYQDRGFVILGFPANNFASQEPGTNTEIKTFCTRKYSVTFPMFSKVSVLGADKTPLYGYLTSASSDPKFAGDIKWNFTKFLIGRDGNIIARFEPKVTPDSPEVISAVESALQ